MEKINIIQKTFYKILQEIGLSPKKASQWIIDKSLTNVERKIIESLLLVRNNQNKKAVDDLYGLSNSEMPFVEAQKNFVLGIALNNLSQFKKAEDHINLALPEFERLESVHFLFNSYFNLCHIFMNTKQFIKMEKTITKMTSLALESDLQKLRLLRCEFNYCSEVGYVDKAKDLLLKIQPHKDSMCESDRISQLVSEFIFFVKVDDLQASRDCLDKMKSNRKFHLSENYNYMKKMLDHLTFNAPLYVYKDDFASTPILDYQIRIINAFEEKNFDLAKQFWEKLNKIYPELYADHFEFKGGKSLFSLCLNKHLSHIKKNNPLVEDQSASNLRKLILIFKNSTGPISKGFLYEQLWNAPPSEKEDLKRLSRLISRLRTEKGMNIASRKGTYLYSTPSKKKNVA